MSFFDWDWIEKIITIVMIGLIVLLIVGAFNAVFSEESINRQNALKQFCESQGFDDATDKPLLKLPKQVKCWKKVQRCVGNYCEEVTITETFTLDTKDVK